MNKSLGTALVVIAALIWSALVFGAGMLVGHSNFGWNNTGFFPNSAIPAGNGAYSGYSMMGGGYRMMGGFGYSNNAASAAPLTVDQAKQAVNSYLKNLNNPDLELKEIMIFDNNAYARITEKSTGVGAMELLVDPASLAVFPEYGPNMMWNLKYGMGGSGGMMGGGMMGGGMMGRYSNPASGSTDMTVTPEQALQAAQQYLDQQYPGYKTAEDADPFYGYYTIDVLKDGAPAGMLSVNGFNGQVVLHTWHGTFIEMYE